VHAALLVSKQTARRFARQCKANVNRRESQRLVEANHSLMAHSNPPSSESPIVLFVSPLFDTRFDSRSIAVPLDSMFGGFLCLRNRSFGLNYHIGESPCYVGHYVSFGPNRKFDVGPIVLLEFMASCPARDMPRCYDRFAGSFHLGCTTRGDELFLCSLPSMWVCHQCFTRIPLFL